MEEEKQIYSKTSFSFSVSFVAVAPFSTYYQYMRLFLNFPIHNFIFYMRLFFTKIQL